VTEGLKTSNRVEMHKMCKRFDEVIALDNVDLSLKVGEVHSLLGENGAGKTTLMNVLSGLYAADSGEILINGEKASIHQPRDAINSGIGMVHQHFELIDNFSALDNIILGMEGGGFIMKPEKQAEQVRNLCQEYGLEVELNTKVKDLAIGIQQKIEILKTLYRGASILILDEPTTMLTPQEVDSLFNTIQRLVTKGLTVVLITHKIHEVLKISHRITIMRRGKAVRTLETHEATRDKLVAMMMGTEITDELPGSSVNIPCGPVQGSCPILNMVDVSIKSIKGSVEIKNATCEICEGQIVGLIGVAGNGQRELAEAIVGLRPVYKGKINFCNEEVTHISIKDRMKLGIALIPEDRIHQGILPSLSVTETLILGAHHFLYQDEKIFNIQKARIKAIENINEFNIKTSSEMAVTWKLSGGNIQKLLLARAFLLDELVGLRLLIAFNPSRGLDIMSTNFVHEKLFSLKAQGKSTLLVSEDLDESMKLCDRMIVVRSGQLVASFDGPNYDPYSIGSAMIGHGEV